MTVGRQQTVYDSIEQLSATLGDRLRNHPSVEIEVRKIFAGVYESAGEIGKARDHLNVALELAKRDRGPDHLIVGEIYARLAGLVAWLGEGPLDVMAMLSESQQAIAIYESHGLDAPTRAWFAKQLCLSRYWPDRKEEAEAACREFVRLSRESTSSEPVIPLWDLGCLLMEFGRFDEAQIEFEKALQECRAGDFPPAITATVLSGLGRNYRRQKNIVAAEDAFFEAWNLWKSGNLQNEPRGYRIGLDLAEVYFAAGDVDQAFDQMQIMEDIAATGRRFQLLAECLFLQGWLHYQLQNYDEAEPLFRQAMQVASEHVGEDHKCFGWPATYLAFTLATQHKTEEAEPLYRNLRTLLKQQYIGQPIVYEAAYWIYVRAILGTCGGDENDLREADRIARVDLDFVTAWPWPWFRGALQLERAKTQQRLGDTDAALRLLRSGLSDAIEPLATYVAMRDHPTTTRTELEVALRDLLVESGPGGVDQAKQVLADGVTIREQGLGRNHIQVELARLRLGEFLIVHSRDDEQRRGVRQMCDVYERLAAQSSTAVTSIRRRTARQLAEFYDAVNQPDEATSWRIKLTQLDQPPKGGPADKEHGGTSSSHSAKPTPESTGES